MLTRIAGIIAVTSVIKENVTGVVLMDGVVVEITQEMAVMENLVDIIIMHAFSNQVFQLTLSVLCPMF